MPRLKKEERAKMDNDILNNRDIMSIGDIALCYGVSTDAVYKRQRSLLEVKNKNPEYPAEWAVADTCVHEYTTLRNIIVDRISANCAASEDLCFMLGIIKGRLDDWQRRQKENCL